MPKTIFFRKISLFTKKTTGMTIYSQVGYGKRETEKITDLMFRAEKMKAIDDSFDNCVARRMLWSGCCCCVDSDAGIIGKARATGRRRRRCRFASRLDKGRTRSASKSRPKSHSCLTGRKTIAHSKPARKAEIPISSTRGNSESRWAFPCIQLCQLWRAHKSL